MKREDLKKYYLPDEPGIYLFRKGQKILYVGKATSLRYRERSYFATDLGDARGAHAIVAMVERATSLPWQNTDSVLEALILEASEIKRHQPQYNVDEKDNKSFNYVVITREEFPRVLVVRGRELFPNMGPKEDQNLVRSVPRRLEFAGSDRRSCAGYFRSRDSKCHPCEFR